MQVAGKKKELKQKKALEVLHKFEEFMYNLKTMAYFRSCSQGAASPQRNSFKLDLHALL